MPLGWGVHPGNLGKNFEKLEKVISRLLTYKFRRRQHMLKFKCNSYFLCTLINSMMTAGTGRRQIHYGSSTRKPTRKAAVKLKQTRGSSPSTSAYVPDELKRRLEEWKQFLRKEEAVILYEKKKQIRDSGFDRIALTFRNLTVDPLEGLLLDLSLHTLNANLKRKYNEVFSQYTCVQLTPASSRYGKYVPYRNGIVIRNGGDSDILRVLIRGATDDRKLNTRELDIRELGTNSAWRLTIESIDTYCKVLLLLNREALLRQMPGFPLLQKTLKISGLDTVLTDRERKVEIDKSLNQSQRAAVMAALNPHRDFVAIHGPPGTGKTKVIAEIVLQFLQNNPKKHVIVCASSNKAVDNALIACVGRGLNQSRCMRVGNEREDTVDQVKDSYYQAMFRQHHFFESYRVVTLQRAQRELERTVERERLQKDPKSKQQALLETGLRRNITSQVLKDVRVVFSTVTSSALQKLLDAKLFKPDLIIMDEASQTMEPFGWKMLLQTKRFVIVGDHQQLQPILRSVRREQLDKPENRPGQSLIQRLMEEFEEKKDYLHLLNTNYRSNELILKWSNRHFYGGKVQTDEKAKSISLAKHIAEKRDKMTSKWRHKSSSNNTNNNNNSNGHGIVTTTAAAAAAVVGSPKNGKTKAAKTTTQVGRQRWIDDPLVLLDTANAREEVEKCKEKYPGLEPKHFLETNGETNSFYNTGEAICAAHQLLALRLHGGLDFHEIGCITPYHQQIKEIRKRLGTNREFDRMDISTVDAFQGQQREAIVMSFVRSNPGNAIGFLSDLRRMNVAITRARRQFFLIASSDSLKNNAELRDLYNIICGEGRVIGITEFLLYNDIQLDFPQRRDRKKENERSEEYSKQFKSALLKVNL